MIMSGGVSEMFKALIDPNCVRKETPSSPTHESIKNGRGACSEMPGTSLAQRHWEFY